MVCNGNDPRLGTTTQCQAGYLLRRENASDYFRSCGKDGEWGFVVLQLEREGKQPGLFHLRLWHGIPANVLEWRFRRNQAKGLS